MTKRLREVLDQRPATETELRTLKEQAEAWERTVNGQLQASEKRIRRLNANPASSLSQIAGELRAEISRAIDGGRQRFLDSSVAGPCPSIEGAGCDQVCRSFGCSVRGSGREVRLSTAPGPARAPRKRNRIIEARNLQHRHLDASVATIPADPFDLRRDVRLELRLSASGFQLLKFSAVGSMGYAVNVAIYTLLLAAHAGFLAAAGCAFVAAVANNYTLNRIWTFRARQGGVVAQGARYLTVSLVALLGNLGLLTLFIWAGMGEIVAQGAAVLLVTPLSFLGNKVWSFGW